MITGYFQWDFTIFHNWIGICSNALSYKVNSYERWISMADLSFSKPVLGYFLLELYVVKKAMDTVSYMWLVFSNLASVGIQATGGSITTTAWLLPNRAGWFLKKKNIDRTRQVAPNCFRSPIPTFLFEMLLFNLAHGIRKFWLLPYNGPKICCKRVFKPAPGGMYSLVF